MRPLAIVPFVLSIIAFSLIPLNILLAGSQAGTLEDYPILTLNLSSVGQNAITFTPANPATTTTRPSAVAAHAEPGGIRDGERPATRIGREKLSVSSILPNLSSIIPSISGSITGSIDGLLGCLWGCGLPGSDLVGLANDCSLQPFLCGGLLEGIENLEV